MPLHVPQIREVGVVSRIRGLQFQMVVKVTKALPQNISTLQYLYIEIDALPTPFFIKEIKMVHSQEFNVILHDMNNELAKECVNNKVYLPVKKNKEPKQLPSFDDNSSLKGVEVFDKEHGRLGVITEILKLPQQELIQIIENKIEILIPFVEDFIEHFDSKQNQLFLKCPPGLLDIYLNKNK
jgi:16S rRNA processing protein RimM